MVDVCVRENDSVELVDWQWKLPIFFSRFLSPPLKHSTVESDRVAVDVKEMTGAGDFARGSDERYLQSAILLLLHRAERAVSRGAHPAT